MKLSNKVEAMQFSPIRRFNPIAQKAKDAGKKVYHLNIGQPDVETPECFMEAIRNYEPKVIAYAESQGLPVLQDAVIEYFKNYDMDVERGDMIITTGGSEALTMIFTALLDEGDEVLLAEPFYTNYHTFATAAGGKVVPITTSAEDGYHYAKREQIEPLITEKTKAICFDGSIFFFPDLANKKIYTKQINMDGTATLKMYELKDLPTFTPMQN